MSRLKRNLIKSRILERCAESGLGAACADAQADGVPCGAPDRECASCDRGAAAVRAQLAHPTADRAVADPT